ncbi:MAG: sigma-70 family RNA polymerase sigma factor [Syntrophorhabdus aromaticivorans]|uniref:Sigma-70 family RNA polymerase sigma factor n=1 Tax=Syntrophorhabdus aromaticivorans TaxID=328301 RepID=A0A971M5M0_9BACT|nr:sigma-70 family RNA polymerase sigma factor [Syntrophorhabdus aromaticivorans]
MEDRYDGSREKELLRMFTNEVEKIAVLTREDESNLAQRLQKGEPGMINRLIEANLRFALKVTFQYWRPGLPLMDMVSEACLGLIVAAKTFNPNMGFRFTTYAEPAIRQRVIRVKLNYLSHVDESLDRPLFQEEGGFYGADTTLKDQLVSEDDNPEEEAEKLDINRYLQSLNKRERQIIELRFWQDKTLDYVGKALNLNRGRVAQIQTKALIKLRLAFRGVKIPWRKEIRHS